MAEGALGEPASVARPGGMLACRVDVHDAAGQLDHDAACRRSDIGAVLLDHLAVLEPGNCHVVIVAAASDSLA